LQRTLSQSLGSPEKISSTKNTKKTRRTIRVFFVFFVDKLIDEFSPLQLAVAAEVDEKADFQASSFEVVQYLRFLLSLPVSLSIAFSSTMICP